MTAAKKLSAGPAYYPMLFVEEMVRKILSGEKTQTRRLLKPQPVWLAKQKHWSWQRTKDRAEWWEEGETSPFNLNPIKFAEMFCPHGRPGDRLWVRETWQPLWSDPDEPGDLETGKGLYVNYPATDGVAEWHHEDKGLVSTSRPSIHMPRWASRITLELLSVRVERLQDISEEDARAEGAPHQPISYRSAFHDLWDSLGPKPGCSWNDNPWVWALSFRRIQP